MRKAASNEWNQKNKNHSNTIKSQNAFDLNIWGDNDQVEYRVVFRREKIPENCIIVIQVDGRKRGTLEMPTNSKETVIIKKSKEIDNVSKHIENTAIIKNIYIKNKLLNFITKK